MHNTLPIKIDSNLGVESRNQSCAHLVRALPSEPLARLAVSLTLEVRLVLHLAEVEAAHTVRHRPVHVVADVEDVERRREDVTLVFVLEYDGDTRELYVRSGQEPRQQHWQREMRGERQATATRMRMVRG